METEEEEAVQTKPLTDAITPLVQRQTAPAEESEAEPEEEEEKEEPIQTKQADAQTAHIGADLQAQIDSMKGGGQPLPHSTRTFFEPRFGYDFSRVRVHADNRADSATRAVSARAFTHGHNIAFGSGQYSPNTSSGQKLLVHELMHVVQQSGIRSVKPLVATQSTVIQRQVGATLEAEETTQIGLSIRVLDYLDREISFHGKQPLTATIRVGGIDIRFPDGGKLYIDRSQTPLDFVLIKQKLETLDAQLSWYIKILGPSLATKGKIDALIENELGNRLFIIRRMTEGKTLKHILCELQFLDASNFQFISVSASVVPFVAGIGIGAVGAPKSAPLRGIQLRAETLRQVAAKELSLGNKRGGPVTVNIGGKGEIEGAINLNPNISSVERAPAWPNSVPARGEAIGDLFPAKSLDAIYGKKLPPTLDWNAIALGAKQTLKPGGKISIYVFGSAEPLYTALRNAGFKDVKLVSTVLVKAVK